jgi:hypothetical protein
MKQALMVEAFGAKPNRNLQAKWNYVLWTAVRGQLLPLAGQ